MEGGGGGGASLHAPVVYVCTVLIYCIPASFIHNKFTIFLQVTSLFDGDTNVLEEGIYRSRDTYYLGAGLHMW